MKVQEPDIIKSSGEKVKFSLAKLKRSLFKSGANENMVSSILNEIREDLYQEISTKELYNKAFTLLKHYKGAYASRYSLKKAIYELGPSGFPFEKFVAEILRILGYQAQLNVTLQGKCVNHEIDIIIKKDNLENLVECKFHSEEGRNCDVKIPLYIHSRFNDIYFLEKKNNLGPGWLVTNTRFTTDALTYGNCVGLELLSWNHPEDQSLKYLIDSSGAYPITTSTLLSRDEKQFLLKREVVLGRHLLDKTSFLAELGISEKRKKRILSELNILCKTPKKYEK